MRQCEGDGGLGPRTPHASTQDVVLTTKEVQAARCCCSRGAAQRLRRVRGEQQAGQEGKPAQTPGTATATARQADGVIECIRVFTASRYTGKPVTAPP